MRTRLIIRVPLVCRDIWKGLEARSPEKESRFLNLKFVTVGDGQEMEMVGMHEGPTGLGGPVPASTWQSC